MADSTHASPNLDGASDSGSDRDLPRRFGKYTLIRKLAVGGMAEIFLALQKSMAGFEKLIVVKRILPRLARDTEFVEMLLAEARIAATLNHPNVAHIYDVGVWNGEYFIAMEHINGEDLRGIVRQMKERNFRSFPIEHSLAIVLGCCKGLQYAHGKTDLDGQPMDIVHRDVSPQNILVTFSGDVKLVDFGIAKAGRSSEETTKDGKLKGKVPYMSPEQAQGVELDARSDVFSLGIILFELCTGRRLFREKRELDTLKKIVAGNYPTAASYNPNLPEGLDEIISKALTVDPDQRYESARAFQADLEDLVRRHQLPVSPISLGAWMRSLFVDKLNEQTRLLQEGRQLASELPDVDHDGFEDLGSMGSVGSRSGVRPLGPGQSPPDGGKSRLGLVVALMVLIVAGGAIALVGGGPGPAELQLNTIPQGANVTVNGEPIAGVTPLTIPDIEVGTQFSLAFALEGYESVSLNHQVTAAPASHQVTQELEAQEANEVGALRLTSRPRGARVFVNGRDTGETTPATIAELRASDEHNISLVLEHYETASVRLRVEPSGITERELTLEPSPLGPEESLLELDVSPSGATVQIGEQRLTGEPPHELRLPSGEQVVVITHPGFRRYESTLTLPGGETFEHRVTLESASASGASGARTQRAAPSAPAGPPGSIRVGSNPWCNVTVGGRSIGQTPIAGHSLPAGTHVVSCVNPELGLRATRRVQVISGQSARVRFNLQ